jgi:putative component of toxin-antitoxin plasmid stabilization module
MYDLERTETFARWFAKLRDTKAKAQIDTRSTGFRWAIQVMFASLERACWS